jgi:hypothetical protein
MPALLSSDNGGPAAGFDMPALLSSDNGGPAAGFDMPIVSTFR